MNEKREWHRRHHDFELFDKIELSVEPRFKTSGLSGDEWRTSVEVKFFFKGKLMKEARFRDMDAALMLLPHTVISTAEKGLSDGVLEFENTKCDQVGCSRDAVGKYRLKRLTSKRGEYLDPSEGEHSTYIRRFCKRHLRRGDADREDADANYEVIEGPGPNESSNLVESPASFGGIIDAVDSERGVINVMDPEQ